MTKELNNLDPRAFLNAYSYLWVVNSNNPHSPLLRGNLVLPVRLIDFVRENSLTHPIGGEHCIKFATAFWESPPEYYKKSQPQYRGKVTLFTPDIENGEVYAKANRIRNYTVDRIEIIEP